MCILYPTQPHPTCLSRAFPMVWCFNGWVSKQGVPKAPNSNLRAEGRTHVRGIEIGPFATSQEIRQTQTQGTQSSLSPFSWDFQIGSGVSPSQLPTTLLMGSALSSRSAINTSSCYGAEEWTFPLCGFLWSLTLHTKRELPREGQRHVSSGSGLAHGCRYLMSKCITFIS